MPMDRILHLAFPVRSVNGGKYVFNLQNTQAEAITQVQTILAFERGFRIESPDFGILDPAFEMMPVDTDDISRAISEFAPDIDYEMESVIDPNSGSERINIKVSLPYADDSEDWPEP
jgi:hypothetical protein